MNRGTIAEARALAESVVDAVEGLDGVEIAVCPPASVLTVVAEAIAGSGVGLGAQDAFWKSSGAYTSQLSAPMLKDVGVAYVILGHSETRGRFGVPEPDFDDTILAHFGESDATVARKTAAVLGAGLVPIVCVGETLAEREAGQTDSVVANQVDGAVSNLSAEQMASVVLAYEPVWAIGTGRTCDSAEANRVCGVARATVAKRFGDDIAEQVRVQYGGSMKPDNAAELLAQTHIDGGLIGGASLKADDFAAIVRAARA
jgi:triosephosphate isomerase (TIM)